MGKYFGTDGVRGRYGDTLNDTLAYRIGRFLGGDGFDAPKSILLSRDTRESGLALSEALAQGVVDAGGEVKDLGVSSTPSVSYLVRKGDADFGVMISASHNPYRDNGIKVFNAEGEKLSADIESRIEDFIDLPNLPAPKGNGKRFEAKAEKDDYLSWLVSKAAPEVKGLRILADLANGSASALAPRLFAALGLDATFLAANPDGRNINEGCGSTHIEALRERFLEGDYDLGVCFDGDADRFMAIAKGGRIIDGDAQIFLSAMALAKRGKLRKDKVVITVMSNFGLRKALDSENIRFDIVKVGDKYVQARLKEEGLSLGGEQSGHVIYLDDLNTGDGLLSMIHLLNLFVLEPGIYAKLPELVVYPQILKNVRLDSREKIALALEDKGVKKAIEEAENLLSDEGRLLVRPSGTEPLIRVMAEAFDHEKCLGAVDSVLEAIGRI